MPPQFLYIELPSFRIKDAGGHSVTLSAKNLGLMVALYHYVRSGLRTTEYCDLLASLLFAGGEPGLWSAANGSGGGGSGAGLHAEENLLLSYFQSFDSPGAYPIVDALLVSNKPCHACLGYFEPGGSGRTLRPGAGAPSFRAKLTPRSDRAYTPVFYLARGLEPAARGDLWVQLGGMWAAELGDAVRSSPDVARGQAYYLLEDSPWFAVNDQENMTDAEVAQAIQSQGAMLAYWIGR